MEAFCYEGYGHSGFIKAENVHGKFVLYAQRNSHVQVEIVRHLN